MRIGRALHASLLMLVPASISAQALPPTVRAAGVTLAQWTLVQTQVRFAASEKKVSEASLAAVCGRIGIALAKRGPVNLQQMIGLIAAKADEIRALDRRLSLLASQNDVRTASLLRQSRAMIDRGELGEADALLGQARTAARASREDAQRREAQVIAAEGKIKELRLDYIGAASDYAEAVDSLPASADQERYQYLGDQAGALRSRGEYFGERQALSDAAVTGRKALALAPRDRLPTEWAATQNQLGVTLRIAASFGDAEALPQSLAAFDAALQVYTRERHPLEWARTQDNRGAALAAAGDRNGGAQAFNDAAVAHRAALAVFSRAREPMDWAAAQNNLGLALQRSVRYAEPSAARTLLRDAVVAERAALSVWQADREPALWVKAQNNLGAALLSLGELGDDAALRDSIRSYRETLRVFTRDHYPADWAKLQTNLGLGLVALDGKGGQPYAAEAATAFRAALEVATREGNLSLWVAAQSGLADTLVTLGRRGDERSLHDGIAAARLVADPQIRQLAPFNWAQAQLTIGDAYTALGAKGDRRSLDDAIGAYRAALAVFTPAAYPVGHKMVVDNLARAQAMLVGKGF